MKYLVPLLLTTAVLAVVVGLALHQARLDARVATEPVAPPAGPDAEVPTEEVPG